MKRYKIKDKDGNLVRSGIYKNIKYWEEKETAIRYAKKIGGKIIQV